MCPRVSSLACSPLYKKRHFAPIPDATALIRYSAAASGMQTLNRPTYSTANTRCFLIGSRLTPHLYTSIMQATWSPSTCTALGAPPRSTRAGASWMDHCTYLHNRRCGAFFFHFPSFARHSVHPMSLASRCFARFLLRSPVGGAGAQNTILLARHRFLSSSPGNGPASATKVASAVKVTETKAVGGGKTAETDQPGPVKLDLCGEIEGARFWAGSFTDTRRACLYLSLSLTETKLGVVSRTLTQTRTTAVEGRGSRKV